MECFYCLKPIAELGKDMVWIGLDRPYINLPMHLTCHRIIKPYEIKWLQENEERIVAEHGKLFTPNGESSSKVKSGKKTKRK